MGKKSPLLLAVMARSYKMEPALLYPDDRMLDDPPGMTNLFFLIGLEYLTEKLILQWPWRLIGNLTR